MKRFVDQYIYILLPYATIYMREQSLSSRLGITNSKRSSLKNLGYEMRITLSTINPDIKNGVPKKTSTSISLTW